MSDTAPQSSSPSASDDKWASSLQPKQAPAESKRLQNVTTVAEGLVLQKPQKPFTLLSAASLGYAITNTPIAILLVVGSAAYGGGPLFFYGTFLMAIVGFSVAISLGELASAYPHAAGQYYWVSQLAPASCKRFVSYMTAIISWASVVCIGASCCSGNVTLIFQLVALRFPEFEYHQWQGFLVFEAVNLIAFGFNIYERFLPAMGKTMMYFSLAVTLTYFISLLAANSPKATAHQFFAEYYNVVGWPNGLAFFIGISGLNWGFSCLDAVTHLSEEIPNPRVNVPRALLASVTVGIVTCFLIVFAIYFAATDFETEYNVVQLVYQIYHENETPALALGSLLLISAWSSLLGIHTWQARIAWALGRDKGFPFHAYIGKLAPAPYNTPIWAHIWSVTWIGLCGFLYLGSTTAFNSFIAAGIILQYLTYSTPVIFLLMHRRSRFQHGPFWLPKLGFAANIILVTWTLISLVFYSFPFFTPVEASSMNYLAAVLFIVFLYALGYWFAYGHKHFTLITSSVIE